MNTEDFWLVASAMMDAYDWRRVSSGTDMDAEGNRLLFGDHVATFSGPKPSVGDQLSINDVGLVTVTHVSFADGWRVVIEVRS